MSIENEDQQELAVRKLLVGERGSAGVSWGVIKAPTLHAVTAIPRLNVSFCATLRAWSLRPCLFQSALDEVRQRFDHWFPRNSFEHLPDHPSHTPRLTVHISSKTRRKLIYYRTHYKSLLGFCTVGNLVDSVCHYCEYFAVTSAVNVVVNMSQ